MTDWILKGGFLYLIVQNLALFARGALKKRKEEVWLARQFKAELIDAHAAMEDLYARLAMMISQNTGKSQNDWAYYPKYRRTSALAFISGNSSRLFSLISKYAPSDLARLYSLVDMLKAHDTVLDTNRKFFVDPKAFTFKSDPHNALLAQANSCCGLATFVQASTPLIAAADKCETGSKIWIVLRRPWAYWPFRLALLLLLIAVPERTDV